MKQNFIMYLIIIAVLGALVSWIGLAFFGVAILSGAIVGALIGLFIPALIALVAFIILIFGVGVGGYWRAIVPVGLLILAWIIASLPGGGL